MAGTKHVTEALSGRPVPPPTADERFELERAQGYLASIAACFRELSERAPDEQERERLRAEARRRDRAALRVGSLTGVERQEVLAAAPELLDRLRAELGR